MMVVRVFISGLNKLLRTPTMLLVTINAEAVIKSVIILAVVVPAAAAAVVALSLLRSS